MTTPQHQSQTTHQTSRSPWWLAADVAAISIFAAIGRRSHDEGINIAGIAQTAAPFVAGAILGWALSKAWRRPTVVRPTGLIVWLSTLVGGMLLRVAFGGSTQASFIVVAGIFLAIFLGGWRFIVDRLV